MVQVDNKLVIVWIDMNTMFQSYFKKYLSEFVNYENAILFTLCLFTI